MDQISHAYAVLNFYYEIPNYKDRYSDIVKRYQKAYETIQAHPADPKPSTEYIQAGRRYYNETEKKGVYSSTFKKVITGWYSPYNGVTNGDILLDWNRHVMRINQTV